MTLVLVVCLLQDNWERVAELEKKAERAAIDGRIDDQRKHLAEARALRCLLYCEAGRMDEARRAWNDALAYGWKGPMPAAMEGWTSPKKNGHVQEQDEEPWKEPIKPHKPKPRSIWEHFAWQPAASTRNHSALSLVHIPPFEEAVIYPGDTWHIHTAFDVVTFSFEERAGGGTSKWKGALLTEVFEADYSITRHVQVGLRVTSGELLEGDDDDIVVFQNNIQIVEAGDRSFNIESLIARVKAALTTEILDFGVLAEFKIPVADEEDLLTAGSFDVAVSGLLSKRFGDWAIHANFGITFPIGEADLFRDNDDFSTLPATNELASLLHFAVGVTWRLHERFTLGFQIEGQDSPFENITILDESAYGAILHGRYELDVNAYLSVALGTGFGDLGSDFTFNLGFDFAF